MRKVEFANGEYYHVYNRGVDKREVFMDDTDYHRFLISMLLLNDEQEGLLDKWRNIKKDEAEMQFSEFRRLNLRKPLVEIVAYCLNDNHYHFILKQLEENGIKKFMQRLGTAYTMYFNKKYKRSGSLFQGTFKAIHIDSNEYLLYLSAYVNQNHFIHGSDDKDWKYSSRDEYENKNGGLAVCNPLDVLVQFKDIEEYRAFLNTNVLHLKKKKEDEKYLLEDQEG